MSVLCLFAFVRIVFAAGVCDIRSANCGAPAGMAMSAHGGAHAHGEVCAIQIDASLHTSDAVSAPHALDAIATPAAVALWIAPATEIPQRTHHDRSRGQPTLLASFGRLRL